MRQGRIMNIRNTVLSLAVLGLGFAVPATSAQTSRPSLDAASASAIIAGCQAWSAQHNMPLTVAVFDQSTNLQALLRMDGALLVSLDIAQSKARTAASLGESTGSLAQYAVGDPGIYHVPGLSTLQGGVPIFTSEGVLIGGVGASGGSGAEDEACAIAGVEAAGLSYHLAAAE
jgi:glc operon protein GlcG